MTSWNYRVVLVSHGSEEEYGIYEVFYEEDQPVARTQEPVPFVGTTLQELIAAYDIAIEAFGLPVLTDRDFNFDA